MTTRWTVWMGALALMAASAATLAQRPERAFTATGTSCSDVTWSQETLQQYPNIGTACREVMQRNGQYFVRFEGEVRRVADRGRQVTIDFRDGDTLTLAPPENMTLFIDGQRRRARDLRPGDELTFFVPQDQLVASFYEGEPGESEAQTAPIAPASELLAQSETPERGGVLPRTAGPLPLAGAGGLLLLLLGAALTVRRRLARRS
ncbi:MAG TPA: hypothetical protein VF322_05095 [Gammaproteobacteria bacterium]